MVSQALMPKRCNVLLEAVKELPPLQVLSENGDGLCHGLCVKAQNLWAQARRQRFYDVSVTPGSAGACFRRLVEIEAEIGYLLAGLKRGRNI